MPHHHHTIDYVELSAPDLGAARAFYAAAFGWRFNDYGPEYAGIQGPDPDSTEAGGLAADGPAHPLVILYSDDLDTTLEAVVAAGGTTFWMSAAEPTVKARYPWAVWPSALESVRQSTE